MRKIRYIMPDPHRKFGEWRLGRISPAILSTDYKSPPLIVEVWR